MTSHQPEHFPSSLTMLFQHNAWANRCLFEACAGLSDEQLGRSLVGGFGSIRDTLQHITLSERSYLHRIRTGQPFRYPGDAPPLTMAELQESIRASGEGLVAAAPQVQPEESVEVDWDGRPRLVPKTVFLLQAINHATEHRAQVMATLTQLGIEPPNLDGWSFFDAHDSGEG